MAAIHKALSVSLIWFLFSSSPAICLVPELQDGDTVEAYRFSRPSTGRFNVVIESVQNVFLAEEKNGTIIRRGPAMDHQILEGFLSKDGRFARRAVRMPNQEELVDDRGVTTYQARVVLMYANKEDRLLDRPSARLLARYDGPRKLAIRGIVYGEELNNRKLKPVPGLIDPGTHEAQVFRIQSSGRLSFDGDQKAAGDCLIIVNSGEMEQNTRVILGRLKAFGIEPLDVQGANTIGNYVMTSDHSLEIGLKDHTVHFLKNTFEQIPIAPITRDHVGSPDSIFHYKATLYRLAHKRINEMRQITPRLVYSSESPCAWLLN